MPIRRHRALTWAARVALLALGAATIATCVAVMLWNDLGPGPLDVFIAAVRQRSGLPLAVVVWITIGTMTAVAWALGRRPGPATLLSPLVVGPTMQVALAWLERFDPPSPLAVRLVIHLVAVGVIGLGAGSIFASGLGAGMGELLTAAAADRAGQPEPRTRVVLEASWLLAGLLLGGPIGIGTVIVALCIGPSVARGRSVVATTVAAGRRQLAI